MASYGVSIVRSKYDLYFAIAGLYAIPCYDANQPYQVTIAWRSCYSTQFLPTTFQW